MTQEKSTRGYWVSTDRPEFNRDLVVEGAYLADKVRHVSQEALSGMLGLRLNLKQNHRARLTIEVSVEVFDENMDEQIID